MNICMHVVLHPWVALGPGGEGGGKCMSRDYD